jgi:hypothetical protein
MSYGHRSHLPKRRNGRTGRSPIGKRELCPRCGLPLLPSLERERECARCGSPDQSEPPAPRSTETENTPRRGSNPDSGL